MKKWIGIAAMVLWCAGWMVIAQIHWGYLWDISPSGLEHRDRHALWVLAFFPASTVGVLLWSAWEDKRFRSEVKKHMERTSEAED